jgi:hypothetical protein
LPRSRRSFSSAAAQYGHRYFREQFKHNPQGAQYLASRHFGRDIAEKMEIEVADDELNGAIASIAQQQGKRFDRVRDELSKGDGLLAMYMQLRDEKILDALLEDSRCPV